MHVSTAKQNVVSALTFYPVAYLISPFGSPSGTLTQSVQYYKSIIHTLSLPFNNVLPLIFSLLITGHDHSSLVTQDGNLKVLLYFSFYRTSLFRPKSNQFY